MSTNSLTGRIASVRFGPSWLLGLLVASCLALAGISPDGASAAAVGTSASTADALERCKSIKDATKRKNCIRKVRLKVAVKRCKKIKVKAKRKACVKRAKKRFAPIKPPVKPEPKPADKILTNGYIYTVDKGDSIQEAVAIRDGELIEVGSNEDALATKGPNTEVVDLGGKMVMPGLQDGHIHGVTVGAPTCDLEYQPMTVADFQAKITECINNPAFSRGPDQWLSASNWYLQFTLPKGMVVTKADLDAVSNGRPVVVGNWDGHTTLANTRALQLAGVTAATPDPPDGTIERDGAGNPTGILNDGAQGLVTSHVPAPPAVDPQVAVKQGMSRLNEQGVTSFLVPGSTEARMLPFKQVADKGELTARGHLMVRLSADLVNNSQDDAMKLVKETRAAIETTNKVSKQVYSWRPGNAVDGPKGVAQPGVSVDGVKIFTDGVIQAPTQTGAMLNPYLKNIGTAADPEWVPRTDEGARGELYVGNPALRQMMSKLELAGFQTHMHTDGDRAVRTALDAVESVRRGNGDVDSRPSLAHNEIIHTSDLPRFKQLDAIPVMSFQWGKPGPDQNDTVKDYFGPVRWDRVEAFGALHGAGAPIAFGSDFPVDALKEWFAMEVAVTHEADWGPSFPEYEGKLNDDPGLSLEQAIRAMTMGSAYEMHQDEVTGSLEEGKLADLIVLNHNLFEIDPDDISETQVEQTMVGGKVVYQR